MIWLDYYLGQTLWCLELFLNRKKKKTKTRAVIRQHNSPGLVERWDAALIFRPWVWARYCSMKLWPSIYDAKYEPDPSSSSWKTWCKISKLWDLDLKIISFGVKKIWTLCVLCGSMIWPSDLNFYPRWPSFEHGHVNLYSVSPRLNENCPLRVYTRFFQDLTKWPSIQPDLTQS